MGLLFGVFLEFFVFFLVSFLFRVGCVGVIGRKLVVEEKSFEILVF